MVLRTRVSLRWLSSTNVRLFGTKAQEAVQVQEEPIQIFRTLENNPANHSAKHLNRFYTMPRQVVGPFFKRGGLTAVFKKQIVTFAECALLIRQPAVEIISYLRETDYSKPVNRYVLYGELGCGKTITLAHILHYGHMTNKVLVHVPWACTWFRSPREVTNSVLKEGFMDLPLEAAVWLKHFKAQNNRLLSELDLKVSKDYQWSQREITSKDSSIMALIEFGVARIKFACSVIIALMEELKEASIAGKCSVLVAIDGYNAFFSDHSRIFDENKVMMPPSKLSLTEAFTNITKHDWCNGAVIVTVDILSSKERRESHFPRYLLNKKGFEHMDPFLPVVVENYTNDEFYIVAEYFKDRKWIRDISDEGLRELQLLCNGNPHKFMELCASL